MQLNQEEQQDIQALQGILTQIYTPTQRKIEKAFMLNCLHLAPLNLYFKMFPLKSNSKYKCKCINLYQKKTSPSGNITLFMPRIISRLNPKVVVYSLLKSSNKMLEVVNDWCWIKVSTKMIDFSFLGYFFIAVNLLNGLFYFSIKFFLSHSLTMIGSDDKNVKYS